MLGVLVSKAGTAIVFVLLLHFAPESLARRWRLYAALWWTFFFFGEVGQAIGPGYSWLEAVGGIIAETIYCPLAAWVAQRLLRPPARISAAPPGSS